MYRTYSAGRQITTMIIRENQDIEYLDLNIYYNSSHQNNYNLLPKAIITEVKHFIFLKKLKMVIILQYNLNKNDSLLTECIYSTTDREYFTYVSI